MLDALRRQSLDVALPCIEGVDLVIVDVETDDLDADFAKAQREGKADIAQTVNADSCGS